MQTREQEQKLDNYYIMSTIFTNLQQQVKGFGLELDSSQIDLFKRHYELLIEWNNRFNLTRVTDPREVETRHFLESLAVAQILPAETLASSRMVDVGSGAGFPCIPLAITFPKAEVTSVESTTRKAQFLNLLQRSLGLSNLCVLTGRAEELAHDSGLRETFDIVLARAVAKLPTLVELTLPFCRVGGKVILHKGPDVKDELAASANAIEVLGGATPTSTAVSQLHTTLIVIAKDRFTPINYPRRVGIPTKRPL